MRPTPTHYGLVKGDKGLTKQSQAKRAPDHFRELLHVFVPTKFSRTSFPRRGLMFWGLASSASFWFYMVQYE
jgi:hypothetical protein